MKKLWVLILAAILTLSFSLPVFADDPTANLMMPGWGGPTDIGDLNVGVTATGFNVEYSVDDPWEIVTTHVYIGLVPPVRSLPRRFPFTAGDIPFEIGAAQSVFIAAQAEVRTQALDRRGNPRFDRRGNPVYIYQIVWAKNGNDIKIGRGFFNQGTYFEYTIPIN
jgi:hypothetical protein